MKTMNCEQMELINGGWLLSDCGWSVVSLVASSVCFVGSVAACATGVLTPVGIGGVYAAELGIGVGVASVGKNC